MPHLQLNTTLLAYARRYAHNRTLAAADVSRELIRVWPELEQWEKQQHHAEILLAISRHEAERRDWADVLDLPI